jgi:predicted ATP-dependent serine protease
MTGQEEKGRFLELTSASDIKAQQVEWLWTADDIQGQIGLLAVGELFLNAGREGIGKSVLTTQIAADLTKGRLSGAYWKKPQNVLIVASEDSWAHTIKPRLVAADADTKRILRVTMREDGHDVGLDLELDLEYLEKGITDRQAVLCIFDPLISRIRVRLDSHKDQHVRKALEPLAELAHETGCTMWGTHSPKQRKQKYRFARYDYGQQGVYLSSTRRVVLHA